MKNKIALFTIIILTLSTGAISTPTSQPPQQTTPYRVDKIWHLGTLNFTVGSLFVYNVKFTDGQIEFTVEDIPRNADVIEIPAEITCNPKFTSLFSIPVFVNWRLEGAGGVKGGGFMLCLPNGEILHSFKSKIGAFFSEDEEQCDLTLDGYISVSILHRVSIPTAYPCYTLHLKRAN